jgi:hypothetical protein
VGGAAILISNLKERGEGGRRRRRLMSFIKILNLPMKFSMKYCDGKYYQ